MRDAIHSSAFLLLSPAGRCQRETVTRLDHLDDSSTRGTGGAGNALGPAKTFASAWHRLVDPPIGPTYLPLPRIIAILSIHFFRR